MYGRRSLIALAAIAAVLLAGVLCERAPRRPARGVRDRVVPEAAEGGIRRVTITRPGRAAITIIRGASGRYRVTAPIDVPADAAAAADLFGAIETLSFRRRVANASPRARRLDPPRETIAVELAGGRRVKLRLGAYIPAAGQAWLARAGRRGAFLVGAAAARSLDRDLDVLRARHPLAGDVVAVEIDAGAGRFRASGSPLAVAVSGGAVRMDHARARSLLGRIAALEIETFTDRPEARTRAGTGPSARGDAGAPAAATPAITAVRVRLRSGSREHIVVRGACPGAPGLRLVSSTIGSGCVAAAALAPFARAARAPEALFSRRLVREDVGVVRLSIAAGGPRLTVAAHGAGFSFRAPAAAAGKPASRSAVTRWLSALAGAAAGPPRPVAQLPSPRPRAQIDIRYAGGDRDRLAFVEAVGRLWARRGDEPVWWSLRSSAEALLSAGPLAFRARALWSEEPYALSEVVRRRGGKVVANLARGELARDWRSVVPSGRPANKAAIFRLRDLFGTPRATSFVADAPRLGLDPPRQVVELHFDPPPIPAPKPGQAGPVHRVALGGNAPGGGCYVRVDGDRAAAVLSAARCKALTAPLVSR